LPLKQKSLRALLFSVANKISETCPPQPSAMADLRNLCHRYQRLSQIPSTIYQILFLLPHFYRRPFPSGIVATEPRLRPHFYASRVFTFQNCRERTPLTAPFLCFAGLYLPELSRENLAYGPIFTLRGSLPSSIAFIFSTLL
jgi:hypothetical protein